MFKTHQQLRFILKRDIECILNKIGVYFIQNKFSLTDQNRSNKESHNSYSAFPAEGAIKVKNLESQINNSNRL